MSNWRDNPRLGYKKVVGELRTLGHSVGRSTVRDVLKRYHILPAPERGRMGSTWSTFLNSHKVSCWLPTFSRWKRYGCRPVRCVKSVRSYNGHDDAIFWLASCADRLAHLSVSPRGGLIALHSGP